MRLIAEGHTKTDENGSFQQWAVIEIVESEQELSATESLEDLFFEARNEAGLRKFNNGPGQMFGRMPICEINGSLVWVVQDCGVDV